MKIKKPGLLILALLITQGAGLAGAVFTASSVKTWYQTLSLPALNPPAWVFGPVWTSLFLLMGIALYLVWQKKSPAVRFALKIFWLQLLANVGWSLVFFGARRPDLAFVEILILWGLIAYTVYLFAKIKRLAGILLVPYLVWVSFAAYLNFMIWQLN